jgi:hypothetical protein
MQVLRWDLKIVETFEDCAIFSGLKWGQHLSYCAITCIAVRASRVAVHYNNEL